MDRAHADLPALSPNRVLPLVREHQGAWRQRYQLQRIGLYSFGEACGYGSAARNQATSTSDVDVWVAGSPHSLRPLHMKQELEDLLQRPVDLVGLRERMNPALRRAILAATPRLSWNLRVTPDDQELIDRAVNASGLTRTDFVLKAARAAAQELLVEQAWSAMEPEAFEAFRSQLDAPANPNERLRRTMAAPRPW